ncbi:hypothetical protein Goshw_020699 [Gossypium schwendimanii]|uniref:60S ribosomal protein L31 n=1 Tax=Gossypium schwendimanii TaxID=34291 RepID=A0A7J9L4Q1_GOSSC|nr:hypothetical protein [Gossypium schwendimanii]
MASGDHWVKPEKGWVKLNTDGAFSKSNIAVSLEIMMALGNVGLLCRWGKIQYSKLSTFKKKAPKAIKEIRKFAEKAMGTKDVRVDVKLNKHIWSRGIRSVPRRIRVRIARKRNDDEDAKEELYSLVTVAEIPAEGLKGLGTKVIDDDDE